MSSHSENLLFLIGDADSIDTATVAIDYAITNGLIEEAENKNLYATQDFFQMVRDVNEHDQVSANLLLEWAIGFSHFN